MPPEHFQHVATFIGEVLGGPADYTAHHGGHANMIRHHLGKGITDEQRKRWVQLLLETADEQGLPSTPSFALPSSPTSSGARASPSSTPLSPPTLLSPTLCPPGTGASPGGPYQPQPPDSNP